MLLFEVDFQFQALKKSKEIGWTCAIWWGRGEAWLVLFIMAMMWVECLAVETCSVSDRHDRVMPGFAVLLEQINMTLLQWHCCGGCTYICTYIRTHTYTYTYAYTCYECVLVESGYKALNTYIGMVGGCYLRVLSHRCSFCTPFVFTQCVMADKIMSVSSPQMSSSLRGTLAL